MDEFPSELPDETGNVGEVRPPGFTDDALALDFTRQHAWHLRYVAAWGKWYEWTGTVWKADETMRIFDYAREICRRASAACGSPGIAASIASAKTVAAVERLAKSDRRHAATVEEWDRDEWLLNTPDGVIELRTSRMRKHRPGDYLTKITAVAPGGECPRWRKFLAEITAKDAELQGFLKRIAGYCLTGSIREHAMFFGYGTGANGKGVFLNTITALMGDYATVAAMETFTASMNDRHPTDLAMLRGARLVTAQETEEGRRWAEARIKAMTGGDPITARFMRQDFFTYNPAFKLFIAGNHKPGLRNVAEAIRRRLNLIPFDVTIAAAKRDHELPEKLKAEWPGILKWMIQGCLEWQAEGLQPPEAVRSATAEYLAAEDLIEQWRADRLIDSPNSQTASHTLFSDWTAWCNALGEEAGTIKRFSEALQRHFPKQRISQGMMFLGVRLRASGGGAR